MVDPERLVYGPKKYAGLHLLLCRWLRLHANRNASYCYVTLGGTELRDIHSLRFIDSHLTTSVDSFEVESERHRLALESLPGLAEFGVQMRVNHATFFSYDRQSPLPHIFFLDLPGICAWGDYDFRFGEMFQHEVIREGDCLIITSHLGHSKNLDGIREHFSGELAILGIEEADASKIKNIYRRSHPTMTLFKGLCLNGIQSEVRLQCFGTVKYRDDKRTPMGIYGYAISAGSTELSKLIGDSDTHYFNVNSGMLCRSEDF